MKFTLKHSSIQDQQSSKSSYEHKDLGDRQKVEDAAIALLLVPVG